MPSEDSTDGYEVVVTHTAKSKAFRYLNEHEIPECLRSPWQVYYDEDRDSFLVRTDRKPDPKNFSPGNQPSENSRIVVIVSIDDESEKIIVVTQTGDHYDYTDYERVDSIGVPIAGGESDA